MPSSPLSPTLLGRIASSPLLDGLKLDGGAAGAITARGASATFAPAAMLAGAIGLAAVWAVAPRETPVAPVAQDAPAVAALPAPSPRRLDFGLFGRFLAGLGAPVALDRPVPVVLTLTAEQASLELKRVEADMLTAAELDAQARLKTVRATFKATGLDARPYMDADAGAPPQGFSASDLRSPGRLASKLDLDPAMARRLQRVATDLAAAKTLTQAAAALPLATPVDSPVFSSPFGMRTDPFTGQQAFHPGQDFAGRYGQPIHVTAPGVVSFAGQRTGYGNCVEVDHGYGFKTRYGHLSGFTLGVGSPVKTGDVIGRMGSTGRSTGVHLHYEVWASGQLLNPTPFLKAGEPMRKG